MLLGQPPRHRRLKVPVATVLEASLAKTLEMAVAVVLALQELEEPQAAAHEEVASSEAWRRWQLDEPQAAAHRNIQFQDMDPDKNDHHHNHASAEAS